MQRINKNKDAVSLAKRHLLKASTEIGNAMDWSFGMLANSGEVLSLLGRIDLELMQIEIQLERLEAEKQIGDEKNGIC